jgi:hypothetical protein
MMQPTGRSGSGQARQTPDSDEGDEESSQITRAATHPMHRATALVLRGDADW